MSPFKTHAVFLLKAVVEIEHLKWLKGKKCVLGKNHICVKSIYKRGVPNDRYAFSMQGKNAIIVIRLKNSRLKAHF